MGPVQPHTTPVDMQILVVSIPLSVRKGAVRHPCRSRAGPVGYEKHCRFPCGTRTTPVWALHGVHVESCELFDQIISVELCQAVWVP